MLPEHLSRQLIHWLAPLVDQSPNAERSPDALIKEVIASGKCSVAIGGSASDVMTITGHNNIVIVLKGDDASAFRRYINDPRRNAPQLPDGVRRLQKLIGRREEQRCILALYEQVVQTRKGCTVIVSGQCGSGRHALVEAVQEAVYQRGGQVQQPVSGTSRC